jgi:hypothetical protein
MELELAEHCRNLDARFYGLTRKRLMKLAFDFAKTNGFSGRFNTVKRLAGKDWVVAFCKLQGLTLRAPEHCSTGRAIGFNTAQVTLFFENLKTCYERNRFPPETCFNMDETGISTVPASVPNVVITKGKRTVCKVTSKEKCQRVTAACFMSASGLYVPPALIFPKKRMAPVPFFKYSYRHLSIGH